MDPFQFQLFLRMLQDGEPMSDATLDELESREVQVQRPSPSGPIGQERRRSVLGGGADKRGKLFNLGLPDMPNIFATPEYMKRSNPTKLEGDRRSTWQTSQPGWNLPDFSLSASPEMLERGRLAREGKDPSRPVAQEPLKSSMSLRPDKASALPTTPTANSPTVEAPMPQSGKELPYQTYQNLTGKDWGRGDVNPDVLWLLQHYGITAEPGSAEANLALQRALQGQGLPYVPIMEG